MMPWWGWTLIGLVVWVSLLYVVAQLLLAHKVMKLQEQMMTDGHTGAGHVKPPRASGWPRYDRLPQETPPLPGDAFAPRHRKQP